MQDHNQLAARKLLTAKGRPGRYVESLTKDEVAELAKIQHAVDAAGAAFGAFWDRHAERLEASKATVEEAEAPPAQPRKRK